MWAIGRMRLRWASSLASARQVRHWRDVVDVVISVPTTAHQRSMTVGAFFSRGPEQLTAQRAVAGENMRADHHAGA